MSGDAIVQLNLVCQIKRFLQYFSVTRTAGLEQGSMDTLSYIGKLNKQDNFHMFDDWLLYFPMNIGGLGQIESEPIKRHHVG